MTIQPEETKTEFKGLDKFSFWAHSFTLTVLAMCFVATALTYMRNLAYIAGGYDIDPSQMANLSMILIVSAGAFVFFGVHFLGLPRRR